MDKPNERANKAESGTGNTPNKIPAISTGRNLHQHNPVDKQNDSSDTEDKHRPLEVSMGFIGRWWSFVKDPQHSGAVVAIFTIVIAVTGVLYTTVSVLQWCANKKAADAAASAAKTAKETLDASKAVQSARLTFDISPTYTVYKPGSGISIMWNPTITNAGGTAATEICVQGEISELRGSQGYYGEPKPIPRPVPHPCVTGDTLGAEQHYSYNLGLDQIAFWDQVLARQSCLIVRWNVSFRDVFGNPQVSPNCYWFNLSANRFERCPPFTQTKQQ